MKAEVTKKPKSTVQLNITVSKDEVKKGYDEVLKQIISEMDLPGFRKGTAPKEKVLEKTNASELYGEVVNVLLQKHYPQALKEHHVSPIANPKVEIKEFDLEKEFEFTATVATKPEVKLGDYKKALKTKHNKKIEEAKAQNAEKLKKGEKIEEPHVHLSIDELIDALIENATVEIADILVDDEVDRMLTRLVNQSQAVGLSLEQYLQAQQKTSEELRKEYSKVSERNLKAEFVLSELIKEYKIEVSEEEVAQAIEASGTEGTKKNMQSENDKWYIKGILAKNKLISTLAEEIEGHSHDH